MDLDENDLNYDRLLTHLKYFAKRIVNNNQDNSTDSNFAKMIAKTYQESYECAVKKGDYILKKGAPVIQMRGYETPLIESHE